MTDAADIVGLPALLRGARNAYGIAVSGALAEAGFGDMPRNGAFVVGGIARARLPLGELVKFLGVSKQAAGQLVDTLVLRDYLSREVDPEDRRRMTLNLTERGHAAAAVTAKIVDDMEAALVERLGQDTVCQGRAVLRALMEMSPAP